MSKREKILIFIAVLLLVTFGFVSIINDLNDKIDVVSAENATLQSEKDGIDIKLGMIDTLEETLENNKIDLETIKESIQDHITDEETDALFTGMVGAYDLTVYSLNISNGSSVFSETEIDLSNIAMKQVSLNLEGDVADFIALVDDINDRGDILVTGLAQSEEEAQTFYIQCVIFMEVE